MHEPMSGGLGDVVRGLAGYSRIEQPVYRAPRKKTQTRASRTAQGVAIRCKGLYRRFKAI